MSTRGASRKSRTILTQKRDLVHEPGSAGNTANDTKVKGEQSSTLKKVSTHKKAAYLQSMNEAEKAANFKIIDNMNKRINFLRNPRFKSTKAPITLNTRFAFENYKVRNDILVNLSHTHLEIDNYLN